jgi:hypothetical protein
MFGDLQDLAKDAREFPVVLGLTQKGTPVTLADVSVSRTSVAFPGYATQEIWARVAFEGAHFPSPSDMRFEGAEVRYSRLADWLTLSGFKEAFSMRENGGLQRYDLEFTFPPKVSATIPGAAVDITSSFHTGGLSLRAVTLRQMATMRITLQHGLPFDAWLETYVGPFQNLISLGTNRPNAVSNLMFFSKTHRRTDSKGVAHEIPIRVYYQPVFHEADPPIDLMLHDMIFTLKDVEADFESVVSRWLTASKSLESVFDLFFGPQYHNRAFTHWRFLGTVHAAETYHRMRMTNEELPAEEHERRVSQILDACPPQFRKWLERTLSYSNEPALRRRVRDLLKASAPASNLLVQDARGFAHVISATRNYFTHYDKELRSEAATGEDLYWLTRKLQYLVMICLLREIGLEAERAAELLKRNESFLFTTRQKVRA